ncbi:ATP-binding cassette, subfamily B [Succiniclasticum ruminis]|uniref:ATP-binding cassette, subfamily B n=1 Tax=Succiniclasticum ruminis TaxID=40841 RepID=A0A1G6M201_9FIRM|nr:ABC transporter ATP-binding protein [Succiniclasticum ruminis]SDC49015.1 ATP-binding cassette, subfamily B [Succiniclasticum ruminis]
MWQYVKRYAHFAFIAALFMGGEVLMDLIQPGLMRRIVDDGVLGLNNNGVGNLELVWHLGIQMIGMVLIGCCFGSLNNVFVNMASQNMGNDLRKDMFRKIMTFSFPQIDRFGAGSLITRITNDVTQVERLIAQFVRGMVRTVLMTIGSLYFMFTLSPDFAFIVLGALPFIIGAMYFALRKLNPLFTLQQEKLDVVNDMLQEDISAIRIIKACVRETYEKLRFGKGNDDLIKTQLKVLLTLAFLNPLVNMVMNLSVAAILWYGARDVMEGAASPGSIMAAITYTTQLLMGIMMLMMLFQNISRGFISWKRLATVLHLEPEIQDGKFEDKDCSNVSDFSFENADAAGQRSENTTKIINTQGHIEFVNVSFTYPGSQKPVLEHINLTINPGETIAIMGSTGSGKTTLINLIPRFYDVTEGSVRIDGVDVRDYKVSSLRRRIAIALQKSELFSTSIKENIAWGRRESDETNTGTATTCDSKTGTAITDKTKTGTASPDELRGNVSLPNETEPTGSDAHSNTAADADIERAARIAQAHEFIAPLEQGYDTVVAERGMSLSGGQKQRIALARAVLKGSPIMIFDDATSALDLKTEANFYNELAKTSPQSTKIIVAQRIASVRRANRILILESGKIVAEGTHKELLKSCAIYQDIYQSQVGDIAQHENATQTENANTTQPKANTTSKEADASAKGGERA